MLLVMSTNELIFVPERKKERYFLCKYKHFELINKQNRKIMKKTKTIKTDRLTREMVKDIQVGATVVYVLPNYSCVESARATIAQMRKLMNADFKCLETGENIITVRRDD